MPKITFVREMKTAEADGSETLLGVMRRAGIFADAPCGGNGKCGKCRVRLGSGEEVLSCRYVPAGDTEVITPDSWTEEGVVLTDGREAEGGYRPAAGAERWPAGSYMAAVDIGTTTVAAYLLSASDGREAAVASCMNPQSRFGADVISRSQYVLDHGPEEMADCIRKAVSSLIRQMTEEVHASPSSVRAVAAAGNTCMHHMFLGLDVSPLVHAPYVPVMKEAAVFRAADYLEGLHPEAELYMLPNIAGFVGADTVGCLVSTRLAEEKDWTLLIDIGTNGEMVLGKEHRLAACSTAAGPAFEGAGISCGMRGQNGAVSAARYADGRWELSVIGGGTPKGLCGSGLLDVTAQLLLSGQIDEYGGLTEGQEVCLFRDPDREDGGEVKITQKDIRQVQLAKAAIAAGIDCLVRKQGIEISDIRRVLLAGAFGSLLSPESACAIGLIPQELLGRITAVGNASGAGVKCVLRSRDAWEYAIRLAAETEFTELAHVPEFQDLFVEHLVFL